MAFANQQHAESVEKGALACPWRTGNAKTKGVARIGHEGIEQLGAERLMTRMAALQQRHRLRQRHAIAKPDPRHVACQRCVVNHAGGQF